MPAAKDGAASGIFDSARRCVLETRRATRAMGTCFAIKLAETFFIFGRLSDSANDGGDMAHEPRPDKEGDMEACAPIPILCSCEADCPRFAKSPLPPWLTSERSRELGRCLRAASYLGFSQSCSFWKCGGNIALTGLTNKQYCRIAICDCAFLG